MPSATGVSKAGVGSSVLGKEDSLGLPAELKPVLVRYARSCKSRICECMQHVAWERVCCRDYGANQGCFLCSLDMNLAL